MHQTKVRIDLNAGTIEAEGTEEFVRSIYADFKDNLGKSTTPEGTQKTANVTTPRDTGSTKSPRRGSGKGKATPKIDKALDLSKKGDVPSLREYFSGFKTKTNFERNLVFVYYLEHIREATPITLDHIFTCYRNVPNVKVPKALQQSLWDTSSRAGWLDTTSSEDIKVTVAGMNYIEHDLAKANDDGDA